MNIFSTEVTIDRFTKKVNIELDGMTDEEIKRMLGLFSQMIKIMELELKDK